jgi:hypothetical protein
VEAANEYIFLSKDRHRFDGGVSPQPTACLLQMYEYVRSGCLSTFPLHRAMPTEYTRVLDDTRCRLLYTVVGT